MAVGNYFLGTPARSQQFSSISPQQANIKGAASNQALNMLQNLGGAQFNFEPIEQQARTNFNTNIIPSIAERFTAMGPGAQRGSAFQSQLGQAGAGLEQGLAALKSQFGLQQQGLNQQLLQTLLGFSANPEVNTITEPEQSGFLENAGNALLQILPIIAGAYFGPAGAAAGSAGGQGLKALFSKLFSSNQAPNVNLPNYSNRIQNVIGQQNPGVNLPDYRALINSVIGVQ